MYDVLFVFRLACMTAWVMGACSLKILTLFYSTMGFGRFLSSFAGHWVSYFCMGHVYSLFAYRAQIDLMLCYDIHAYRPNHKALVNCSFFHLCYLVSMKGGTISPQAMAMNVEMFLALVSILNLYCLSPGLSNCRMVSWMPEGAPGTGRGE